MGTRLWIIGFGAVGQWLARALYEHEETLATRHRLNTQVVGVANSRDGFVYRADGLDVPQLLELASAGYSLAEHAGARHWPTAAQGIAETEADVLVEVTASQASDAGEPGVGLMRSALERDIPVVTSNKWPVALHGVELVSLARARRVSFLAESTVMSGTPLLSTLTQGLAGTTPLRLRGVLNATANFILTLMEEGDEYEDALEAAKREGLAEPDPSADVQGYDAMSKAMILAALVFGEQLRPEGVARCGIADIDRADVESALSSGAHLKELVTVERSPAGLAVRIEPTPVPAEDVLARVRGATNALTIAAEPVGDVTIVGPGAGPKLAGQGVLSDLIAVAGRQATRRRDLQVG